MQRTSDDRVRREAHVWYQRPDSSWKCVICGGVSFCPNDLTDCVRYEQLTEDERRMCLPKDEQAPVLEHGKTERKGKRK